MSNSIGTSFSPSATGKSGYSSGGIIAGPGLSENIFISNNPSLGRPRRFKRNYASISYGS